MTCFNATLLHLHAARTQTKANPNHRTSSYRRSLRLLALTVCLLSLSISLSSAQSKTLDRSSDVLVHQPFQKSHTSTAKLESQRITGILKRQTLSSRSRSRSLKTLVGDKIPGDKTKEEESAVKVEEGSFN